MRRQDPVVERRLRSDLESNMRELGAPAELILTLRQLPLEALGEFSLLVIEHGQTRTPSSREQVSLFLARMLPSCTPRILEQAYEWADQFARAAAAARRHSPWS